MSNKVITNLEFLENIHQALPNCWIDTEISNSKNSTIIRIFSKVLAVDRRVVIYFDGCYKFEMFAGEILIGGGILRAPWTTLAILNDFLTGTTKFKWVVLDKYGWPVEKITSRIWYRNWLHRLNYYVRCMLHGRKISLWNSEFREILRTLIQSQEISVTCQSSSITV